MQTRTASARSFLHRKVTSPHTGNEPDNQPTAVREALEAVDSRRPSARDDCVGQNPTDKLSHNQAKSHFPKLDGGLMRSRRLAPACVAAFLTLATGACGGSSPTRPSSQP